MDVKCLTQTMTHLEHKAVKALPVEKCEVIAQLAELQISFENIPNPGEHLIKYLDRAGTRVEHFRKYFKIAQNKKIIHIFYEPQSKIAILIANHWYSPLSKLATPPTDCNTLGLHLSKLGFIVVAIRNTVSSCLKNILNNVVKLIPENSYCLVFYAGHGCETSNTKCILCIDCPQEDITLEHCVTENYILNAVAKCKPDLCILIMDMCRVYLDRDKNPQIYSSISSVEPSRIDSNLLISYSTQSSLSAFEKIEMAYSTSGECDSESCKIIELDSYNIKRVIPQASQYVNALCSRLGDDLDISSLLDKVHADVESCRKKQRPMKVQCGSAKRSLYDTCTGDSETLLCSIKESCKGFMDYCDVY